MRLTVFYMLGEDNRLHYWSNVNGERYEFRSIPGARAWATLRGMGIKLLPVGEAPLSSLVDSVCQRMRSYTLIG